MAAAAPAAPAAPSALREKHTLCVKEALHERAQWGWPRALREWEQRVEWGRMGPGTRGRGCGACACGGSITQESVMGGAPSSPRMGGNRSNRSVFHNRQPKTEPKIEPVPPEPPCKVQLCQPKNSLATRAILLSPPCKVPLCQPKTRAWMRGLRVWRSAAWGREAGRGEGEFTRRLACIQ